MSYGLFIDDEESIRTAAREMAATAGLRLDVAASWEEGIQSFYALSPDLVISDYNLPGSTLGLQLLLEIRRLRPSVRLVLISAFLNPEDVDRVMELGLVDRVVRKTDPVQTARVIVEELRRAKIAGDSSTQWADFAVAAVSYTTVSQDDLQSLDDFLRVQRLGSDPMGDSK